MAGLSKTLERFKSKHEVIANGCWNWTGYVAPDGYGKLMAFGEQYAHRVSYILHNGSLPKSLDVMHTCDNRRCVNPEHLKKCVHSENMADMSIKKRSCWGESHRSAKLTEDDVRYIRNSKEDIKFIANKFGVAEVTARQAKAGITWKHLD